MVVGCIQENDAITLQRRSLSDASCIREWTFLFKIKKAYNFIFGNIRFALPNSYINFDYVQLENFRLFFKEYLNICLIPV